MWNRVEIGRKKESSIKICWIICVSIPSQKQITTIVKYTIETETLWGWTHSDIPITSIKHRIRRPRVFLYLSVTVSTDFSHGPRFARLKRVGTKTLNCMRNWCEHGISIDATTHPKTMPTRVPNNSWTIMNEHVLRGVRFGKSSILSSSNTASHGLCANPNKEKRCRKWNQHRLEFNGTQDKVRFQKVKRKPCTPLKMKPEREPRLINPRK